MLQYPVQPPWDCYGALGALAYWEAHPKVIRLHSENYGEPLRSLIRGKGVYAMVSCVWIFLAGCAKGYNNNLKALQPQGDQFSGSAEKWQNGSWDGVERTVPQRLLGCPPAPGPCRVPLQTTPIATDNLPRLPEGDHWLKVLAMQEGDLEQGGDRGW